MLKRRSVYFSRACYLLPLRPLTDVMNLLVAFEDQDVKVVFVFAYPNVIWLTRVLCISMAVNRIGGFSDKSSRWSIF